MDPEKLEATLTDRTLSESCDLKRALEMVALLEAQLKEMNPNLDSIAEYVFHCSKHEVGKSLSNLIFLNVINIIGIGEKCLCTMSE